MNQFDQLEARLQSWKPRAPSAELGERLFPPSVRPVRVRREARWLAPALAALTLAGAVWHSDRGAGNRVLIAQTNDVRIGLDFDSALLAACLERSAHSGRNRATRTFEWTIPSGWPSSMGSFSAWATNGLIP